MSTRISNEPTVIEQDKVGYDQILVDPTRNMRRFPPPAKDIQDLATDGPTGHRRQRIQVFISRRVSTDGSDWSVD